MSEQAKGGVEQADVIEILEQLCGWRRMRHVSGTSAVLFSPTADVDSDFLDWWKPVDVSVKLVDDPLPPIATDETAAFAHVVSAMKAKNLLLLLFETKNGWFARFAPTGEDVDISQPIIEGVDWFASRNASSPSEAICLAALSMIRGREQ